VIKDSKENEILRVEEKGFPMVKILWDEFQIKALDYWDFRTFKYSDVKRVSHYNPNDNWFMRLYISTSIAGRMFAKKAPWILKIVLKNGGDWTYKTSPTHNMEFRKALKLIEEKISLQTKFK
jgi:hypothetical protein